MKKIVFFLVPILLLGITGCKEKQIDKTDAILFREEYENLNKTNISIEIPSNNGIVYSSIEESLEIIKNGTGVIYFGFPECPWCRNAIPTLLNTALMTGISNIYYVNAKEMRDIKKLEEGKIVTEKEVTEEYYKLLNALDSVLPPYRGLEDETIKRLYFPTVIFVKEGNIIGMHEGTVESQEDPSQFLTKEQEQELSKIYSTYMHEILGDVCDKSC